MTTSDGPARVLVVDGDPVVRRGLARTLLSRGHEVLTAESPDAAAPLLATSPVDVVILEASAAGGGAGAVLRLGPLAGAELVIVTAPQSLEIALAIAREHALEVLAKPFASDELAVLAVARAAMLRGARDDDMIVASKAMRAATERALDVASADVPLAILGEAGAGKSLLAEMVRRQDHRHRGPWVVLAGNAPAHVLEEALGGPSDVPPPAFVSAREGTLVLDHASAFSAAAQASLWAHLEHVPPSDVPRLLLLGPGDLGERALAGSFRRELFFRLAAVAVTLPPLRQRRDELPVLAHHFLARASARLGRRARRFGVEAIKDLRAHPWPGNVRELESVVLRAASTARGETVYPTDLELDEAAIHGGPGAPISLPPGCEDLPYPAAKEHALAAFHAAYLGTQLERAGGNVSEAARRAGLDRSNFRRLLRRQK